MLDKIGSRFIDMFKIDDALLNMLGARSAFKSFHPKRQGKVAYYPNSYFGEDIKVLS